MRSNQSGVPKRAMLPKTYIVVLVLALAANAGLGRQVRPSRHIRPDKKIEPTSQQFTCLPKDVRGDEIVSYGPKGTQKVTVENKLTELKARCKKGKLVDAKGREIRFFRLSCWGNPPPDYLEIQRRENKELTELRKRYTVIVFSCSPMTQ
jgi:hypothetical protein